MRNYIKGILIFIISIVGLSSSTLMSQSASPVDSLKKALLKSKHDTTRVNILNDLCWEYNSLDFDSSLAFGIKASDLARKTKYNKGLALGLNYIGVLYILSNKPDSGVFYINLSIEINKRINNETGLAANYLNLGENYRLQSIYKASLEYFEKALNLHKKYNNKEGIIKALSNIGLVYYDQGDFAKSLDYMYQSLKYAEEFNDKNGLGTAYGNIGLINSSIGEYEKAIEFSIKSQKIYHEIGDNKSEARTLNNTGGFLINLEKNDEAIEYLEKALKISGPIGDSSNYALTLCNIAVVSDKKGDTKKAIEILNNAAGICKRIGSVWDLEDIYILTSTFEIKIKKYPSARRHLEDALDLSKQIGAIDAEKNCYYNFTNLDSIEGNFSSALMNYKKFIALKDSIFNNENTKKLTQIEMQYEFDKVKKEQEKKELLQTEEIKRQKMLRYSFTIGFILTILLVGFVFRSYRIKKKSNILLKKQNIEIQQKSEEIAAQRDEILTKNEILTQQKEEIVAQRDEIESQRDEIEAQRDKVTEQRDHIETIHHELTDSIYYAKRIQQAVLPSEKYINSILSEYFILFNPRDIVSGDFYYVTKKNHWILAAVADCTGHGVPGAFMSMLGVSLLSEIAVLSEINEAGKVLDELRNRVIHALQQKGISGEQKDGMDISFIALNTNDNTLQFAGANNPLYVIARKPLLTKQSVVEIASLVVRNDDPGFYELKGDKMPVAIHERMDPFTTQTIKLNSGDIVYLMSDGFADQFGGPKEKKYLSKNLKQAIIDNSNKSLPEQKEILNTLFSHWKGSGEQTDDVTLMGIMI